MLVYHYLIADDISLIAFSKKHIKCMTQNLMIMSRCTLRKRKYWRTTTMPNIMRYDLETLKWKYYHEMRRHIILARKFNLINFNTEIEVPSDESWQKLFVMRSELCECYLRLKSHSRLVNIMILTTFVYDNLIRTIIRIIAKW